MAQPLKEWARDSIDPFRDAPNDWLCDYHFQRDPVRTVTIDSDVWFAPADGTIIYQTIVNDPDAPIIEIKGVDYTLADATGHAPITCPALVIGIFLTVWDVHVQRAAQDGFCTWRQLPPIESTNRTMIGIETAISDSHIDTDECDYLFTNERVVHQFRNSHGDHYVLSVADADVDAITPFQPSGSYYGQGDKFSSIRFGSQVDLIVPDITTLDRCVHTVGTHVEAAVDVVVA
jgi:phosphatidylserine decarboxylase